MTRILRRPLTWVVLVAALGIAIAAIVVLAGQRRGEPTADAAAHAYAQALAAGDRSRLETLADPAYDDSAVDRALGDLGGERFTVSKITVGPTSTADLRRPAVLTGEREGNAYSQTIWVRPHDHRWYVILGQPLDAQR